MSTIFQAGHLSMFALLLSLLLACFAFYRAALHPKPAWHILSGVLAVVAGATIPDLILGGSPALRDKVILALLVGIAFSLVFILQMLDPTTENRDQ